MSDWNYHYRGELLGRNCGSLVVVGVVVAVLLCAKGNFFGHVGFGFREVPLSSAGLLGLPANQPATVCSHGISLAIVLRDINLNII